MEPIVENVYITDEKALLEIQYSRMRVFRICITAYFLYVLCQAIPALIFYQDFSLLFTLTLCIVVTVFTWLQPALLVKNSMKANRWFYDNTLPEYKITFTQEHIVCSRGRSTMTVPYEKITNARFFKRSLVLRAGGYAEIHLLHGAYTVGSRDVLLDLLRARCPDLKLPPWDWEHHS